MKNLWFLILTSLFVVSPCFGGLQNRIAVRDKQSLNTVSLQVLESNEHSYKVKVKINSINERRVNVEGVSYHQIYFDDENNLQNIGEPALPVITQFIGIPIGSNYSKKITEEVWTDINIGKIFPAQHPYVGVPKDTTFLINESIYNDAYYKHNLLTESKIMNWKGIDNVILTICPFKYYPMENRLSVLSEFTLTVRFSDLKSSASKTIKFKDKDLGIFSNSSFISAKNRDLSKKKMIRNNDDYDYLIIVGNIPEIENSQEMKDFRRWKALKGFRTKLVSTNTIGSDSNSIKNFIKQEYETFNIEHVLFVGNHEKIPFPILTARVVQDDHPIVKSDYWYGCMGDADDIEAEIPVGRFITNTLEDFSNIIRKTIQYESLNHSWSDKILLVANMQWAPGFYQGCMEEIVAENYASPMSFCKAYAASSSVGGNDATATDVYNYVNEGINIVAYNGHGNEISWWLNDATPCSDCLISQSDTARISKDAYPVIVSMACKSADFSFDNSIIWQWTRSDHCTSAYIGGSVPVFSYAANDYLKNFHNELLNNDNYILGNLSLTACILGFSGGNTAIDNAFCIVCGGDPSLELWTGIQSHFLNPSFSISGNSLVISVDNIDDFNVNIASGDGIMLGKYNSQNESSVTIPLPSGDCDIALVKHNYVPYVIRYRTQYIQNEVISGSDVYAQSPIQIGYDVTDIKTHGNVSIEPNNKMTIHNGNGSVIIKNGFECKLGAELEIK